MPSTRKLPVRIDDKKHARHSEHLIPQLSDSPNSGFVSVKTGKPVEVGMVAYLGRDVTPEMMLERYCRSCPTPSNRTRVLNRLAAYCEALQSFKIGNVLSVSYSPEGLPILRVEQEHILCGPNRRLP